jgi:sentrin-specific protease 7
MLTFFKKIFFLFRFMKSKFHFLSPLLLVCHFYIMYHLYSAHWYLAVICYPGKLLLPSALILDEMQQQPLSLSSLIPCVLLFDSLGGSRRPRLVVVRTLQQYLYSELSHRGISPPEHFKLPGLSARVPSQLNFCDCGVFLLHYVELFLRDLDGTLTKLLQHPTTMETWFDLVDITTKRRLIRSIILGLVATEGQSSSSSTTTILL